MSTFTVTGNDTLVLNGNVFNDMATGTVTEITFPNELVNVKTGKNKNSIIALNQQGYNGVLVIKLNRGSADDQFLANILANMLGNFVATPLISGSFTKQLGDGAGGVTNDVYSLAGGVISKIPGAMENVEGEVAQAETTYNIKFTNCGRSIE